VGRTAAPAAPAARPSPVPAAPFSATRPPVPGSVAEYFLPNNLSLAQAFEAAKQSAPADTKNLGLVYRPAVLGQASIRFLNRTYDLDYDLQRLVLVQEPDRRGMVRWEDFSASPLDPRRLDDRPDPDARFYPLEAPLSDAKLLAAMQKDFLDWAYRAGQVSVWANKTLKLFAGPQATQAEFRQMCSDAAREARDQEVEKAGASFDKKIEALQDKIDREERELAQDESEHSQRKMEELGSAAETLFGMLGRRKSRRRLSSSLTKRRMTAQARADVQESKEAIEDYKKQIQALEKEKAQALEQVGERWGEIATQVDEISVAPARKDVLLDFFGVAWLPYYRLMAGDREFELPAYELP
jgi:hypothetical protein